MLLSARHSFNCIFKGCIYHIFNLGSDISGSKNCKDIDQYLGTAILWTDPTDLAKGARGAWPPFWAWPLYPLPQFSFLDSGSSRNVGPLWDAALLIISLNSITPIFFLCNYGTTQHYASWSGITGRNYWRTVIVPLWHCSVPYRLLHPMLNQ